MSGHSKWANIKHRKAATDAKKGKVFTRLAKALMSAAREGGGDPDMNAGLRLAIDKAKAQNMPNDNIDRAIKRGTGELGGATFESVRYEGYGPGGVAVLIEGATDNRNRTAAEIRTIFNRSNGSLGENGCVSWMFDKVGQITVPAEAVPSEDELMLAAIEGGADDVSQEGETWVVTCAPELTMALRRTLQVAGFGEGIEAELTRRPQTTVTVSGRDAENVYRLLESLEEYEDVDAVYANAEFEDDQLDHLEA